MVMQSSGDPVPSISEAEAKGGAELYADIRETLGMSFVNMIWRHLASIPGGLRWTWQMMKPLYENGAVYDEADSLREAQALPSVSRFSGALGHTDVPDADTAAAVKVSLANLVIMVGGGTHANRPWFKPMTA